MGSRPGTRVLVLLFLARRTRRRPPPGPCYWIGPWGIARMTELDYAREVLEEVKAMRGVMANIATDLAVLATESKHNHERLLRVRAETDELASRVALVERKIEELSPIRDTMRHMHKLFIRALGVALLALVVTSSNVATDWLGAPRPGQYILGK